MPRSTPGVGGNSVPSSTTPPNSISTEASMSSTSPENSLNATKSQPTQPIPKKSQQIKTDKPRPHSCTVCTRAFARLEHLKRHERSHTNEKPFQCASCGRCFARRDLVLRHQQKLHATLMRSNSVKDLDTNSNNEHIIILHNNTNANAPLPDNSNLSKIKNESLSNVSSPTETQLFSPNDSSSASGTNEIPPQFKTGLFNYAASPALPDQSPPNQRKRKLSNHAVGSIPLPIQTTSSLNTPPTLANQLLQSHSGSPRRGSNRSRSQLSHPSVSSNPPRSVSQSQPMSIPLHLRQSDFKQPVHQYQQQQQQKQQQQQQQQQKQQKQHDEEDHHHHRHASFSAASAISYTNIRDALSIQQNNNLLEAPLQVEFATPQLLAADLSARGLLSGVDLTNLGIDWNNIESLDLNTPAINSDPNHSKNQYFDQNVMASHQFSNPNHPHHIRGTTPFDLGLNPPTNDLSLVQQILQMGTGGTGGSGGTGYDDLSNDAFELNHNALLARQKKSKSLLKKAKLSDQQNNDQITNQQDVDWLQEIINTPYEAKFPNASHHIGFTESPLSDTSPKQIDEILSLFRSRQIDLVKQMNPIMPNLDLSMVQPIKNEVQPKIDINDSKLKDISKSFFNDDLRNKIIKDSNLNDSQFPPLSDLDAYMTLYEKEFNKFFPFIHLPSLKNPMVENLESIPLLLSMAAIGALYSYHDSNTLLLFNLSKYHIQHFFEKEITMDNLQFKKVPLMAHQCLVLHIFISMFLNEPNMVDITARQLKSMVGLIRSTNFNKPLEQFIVPPSTLVDSNDMNMIQNNFDYFIMSQSRIRTIHCFYMLQVFRTTLTGLQVPLLLNSINCGTHCSNENLWRCEDAGKWINELKVHGQNQALIDISNNQSMNTLIALLENHYFYDSKPMSFNNCLSLLMYIHEQISIEYSNHKDANNQTNLLNWRLEARPKLKKLIKSWESFFIKNGGFLIVNDYNEHLLNLHNEFKLILPLLLFAKIRLCININPLMDRVLYKDWNGMNDELKKLDNDEEGLKESIGYAVEIINIWIHNISVINDSRETSLRTPVFFVTCVFVSILIISKYLDSIENTDKDLTIFDKVYWLNCDEIFYKIETNLSPINESNSYSDFLRRQSNGVFDSISSESFKESAKMIKTLIESNTASSKAIVTAMKNYRLATRSLYMGVRILADAPVWPLAMGFAEALKNRATYISS
ncbi:hypothetical protein HYPBUDRAFT_110786 [Hyphopichia burtonii NRRL Y-1933]|uniref:C2H2-type domain-containing protein n=1 Tax=Hyphopichia burtonii NRRL Y-1933 TaxID=984485 RepID=A0A1E4RHA2_9ASCO|nr:hypothetical protein HYPBUDRAFT_110786 [Hyphopichia burtonii NRRL Y-1933]ODV66647.1 hypothetical protein HYPBUDRAFT_110786 [Hyphopichia burtonii NRRL Y-1933]